jgi:multiple sugar transport system permease protein
MSIPRAVSTKSARAGTGRSALAVGPAVRQVRRRRPSAGRVIRKCWLSLVLAVVVVWSVMPIFITVMSAFKPPLDIFSYPPRLIPRHWTVANFRNVFSSVQDFRVGLENSAQLTLGAIVLAVVISLLAAYGLSRYPSRTVRGLGMAAIVLGMFPPIVVTVPLFPMINYLHLDNSKITLIVLYAALQSTVIVWIMKTFLDNLPRELEEAAYIDGASRWRAFWSIILPLARPTIVTGAVLAGMFAWNEYTLAFLFTSGASSTAPVVIAGMIDDLTGANWGAILAASTVQFIPALVALLAIQRHLVGRLADGSVKG